MGTSRYLQPNVAIASGIGPSDRYPAGSSCGGLGRHGSFPPVIAGHPVDELTNDVHVAGVSSGLLDHVNEHPTH